MMPVTVLGVGNPIMGDDAIGVELLARVRRDREDLPVEWVDGGIGGLDLLPVVTDTARLLILDAVAGTTPGTVQRLSGDQIPRMLAAKLSPHQVSMLDVLAAARLLGKEPEVEAVGIVPASVDLRVGLSEEATAALDEAAVVAGGVLQAWLAEDQS